MFSGFSVDSITKKLRDGFDYDVTFDEDAYNSLKEFASDFYRVWQQEFISCFDSASSHSIAPEAVYCLMAHLIDKSYYLKGGLVEGGISL